MVKEYKQACDALLDAQNLDPGNAEIEGELRKEITAASSQAIDGNEKSNDSGAMGESSASSEISAPLGFPFPAFLPTNDLIVEVENSLIVPPSLSTDDSKDIAHKTELLGKEGVEVWYKHFAPSNNDQTSIQGAQEQEVNSLAPSAPLLAQAAASTSAMHNIKKRKEKVPLVETEVRRSCRLQQLAKGYKKKDLHG
uniref:Uncharacterized protein n=1 Tax=Triticum aestivum TaxID=4565 RepID=A0A077RQS8_WHEAT|nr:unnamed protein product [Triticum aestivum]